METPKKEDQKEVHLTVVIRRDLYEAAKIAAVKEKKSLKTMISAALAARLA
jgi:predicted HicB family RNase H-like nuclease